MLGFFSGIVREPLDVNPPDWSNAIHTVLVKYVLPGPVPRDAKLIRKYFSYDESENTGHSVCLWESEGDAGAFSNDEFVTGFKAKFGTVPELFYVDSLMVIDNEAEKTTTS